MAEAHADVDTLKRRGRRRLVGAIALALLAVIVLPMVFDPEPRGTPPVSVRIPGEDEKAFAPKPVAKAAPAAPAPVAPPAEEKKAAEDKKSPEKKPDERKVEAKKAEPRPSPAERARAEAALADSQFVVQVGAFANPQPVLAKLQAAKIRYYTEKAPSAAGEITRVRVGPFATKAEADRALAAVKKLGLPGSVAAKS